MLKKLQPEKIELAVMAVIGIALALLVRYYLRAFASIDFIAHFGKWYALFEEQGFSAFRSSFSNYPPLYLYSLYFVSQAVPGQIDAVTAEKLPSIACDFICAWFVYKIVRLKYDNPLPAFFSFFAVLFAPTVIFNSAVWGQADSVYTAAIMGGVYFLLKQREKFAFLAFGLAFAAKLQSIFIMPFLLVLWARKKISWHSFLLIPVVYIITIIPVWIAGRPLWELLTIYGTQLGDDFLTRNIPNLYVFLPNEYFAVFAPAGIIFAGSICLFWIFGVYKSPLSLEPGHFLQLAVTSLMIVPYFLPKMHERYFFPADVLTIAYGFYYPKKFYVPIVMNLISFFAYQPFLFSDEPISFSVLALAMLALIVFMVRETVIASLPARSLATNQ